MTTTSYSLWRLFRNCRKACELRYIQNITPIDKNSNLAFGSIIHKCLEDWYSGVPSDQIMDQIDRNFPNRLFDEKEHAGWHLARAMMLAYIDKYATKDFTPIALEKEFSVPIVNPKTRAKSRTFNLSGKVDGIVRMNETGNYFLLEHKTASILDSNYLEKLWTDMQITLYSRFVEKALGYHITGVIYNVLVKAKLQQGKGETESEFQTRLAELIAKSKTGKSSAKRKMPETDDEFAERLRLKYLDDGMLHRELIYISRDQQIAMEAELWELSKQFLDAKRRSEFYHNTEFCFKNGCPCEFLPYCRSGENPNLIGTVYEIKAPHEELSNAVVAERPF